MDNSPINIQNSVSIPDSTPTQTSLEGECAPPRLALITAPPATLGGLWEGSKLRITPETPLPPFELGPGLALRSLSLCVVEADGVPLGARELVFIATLPALTDISLVDCSITDEVIMEALDIMKSLGWAGSVCGTVNLANNSVSGQGVSELFPFCEHLVMHNTILSDLTLLTTLPLRSLDISSCPLSTFNFANLPTLRTINVSNTSLTTLSSILTHCRHIRSLTAHSCHHLAAVGTLPAPASVLELSIASTPLARDPAQVPAIAALGVHVLHLQAGASAREAHLRGAANENSCLTEVDGEIVGAEEAVAALYASRAPELGLLGGKM